MSEEGSTFKVPLTKILEIQPHNNATSLEFAVVYGFRVVVRKGEYKAGDIVLYIPIDSVIPRSLEEQLFPSGSKIKLHRSRVKQIKIRGEYSQGMVIDLPTIQEYATQHLSLGYHIFDQISIMLESNLAEQLGVTKYQPPEASYQSSSGTPRDKAKENPYFHKYNGVENIKWYPELFKEDEEVVVQEKLHGSCCRAAILPFKANTLWKKVLKVLKLAPANEYCYGSNNVQLQERGNYKGWYGDNVYKKVLDKVEAFQKMKPGEIIYGELIGEGIQKNYTYGHKEHHFVLFDVKVLQEDGTTKWLNPEESEAYAKERGFDFVPVLFKGLFNKEITNELTKGSSVYCSGQKVREGIVIKSRINYNDDLMPSNKKCVKWLSEKYLEGDQSDFH